MITRRRRRRKREKEREVMNTIVNLFLFLSRCTHTKYVQIHDITNVKEIQSSSGEEEVKRQKILNYLLK